MESPQEQKEIAGRLTHTESQRLKGVIVQIQNLIDHPDITEEKFYDVTNALSELTAIREVYLIRLLGIFKRGYVVGL